MLKKFKVKGFKNFKDKLEFDLTAGGYDFNQEAVNQDIVKTAVIYGPNGSGKTNFGYAIFDIVMNLTDKEQSAISRIFPPYYLNLDTESGKAFFSYEFQFDRNYLIYSYEKTQIDQIITEKLIINGETVIEYDKEKNIKLINLSEAQNLNVRDYDGKISFVRYVYRNSILNDVEVNGATIKKFYDFVERMLLFRDLDKRIYVGFTNEKVDIYEGIAKANKVKDFENFLRKFGLDYKLYATGDGRTIYCEFKYGTARLASIASTGTKGLSLFFYWYMQMKDASFVFIDEFDAFYHWDISKEIIEILKNLHGIQSILTTHNTNNMSNDLLRPDCYYILNTNGIKSLPKCTDKELRLAHNLKKMLVAGKFNHGK